MGGDSGRIKKGLKRKVKQPPAWPGQIPDTRRINQVREESTPNFYAQFGSPKFDQVESTPNFQQPLTSPNFST